MDGHTYLRTHDLAAEHLLLDLAAASEELRARDAGAQDRQGITLVRQGGLSIVLSHLRAGSRLQEHAAPGAATVQVLEGEVRAQVGDASLDLAAGHLVAFDAKVRHSVEAVTDATLLLTLADAKP